MSFLIEGMVDVVVACTTCPSRLSCRGFLYCNNSKNTSSASTVELANNEQTNHASNKIGKV